MLAAQKRLKATRATWTIRTSKTLKEDKAKIVSAYDKIRLQSFSLYGPSLLHRGFIVACLPDFYLFKLGDFKATASRYLKYIFKRALREETPPTANEGNALSSCSTHETHERHDKEHSRVSRHLWARLLISRRRTVFRISNNAASHPPAAMPWHSWQLVSFHASPMSSGWINSKPCRFACCTSLPLPCSMMV